MGRKRPKVVKNKVEVKTKPKCTPLMKAEGQYFQELVDVSNRYQALLTQKKQYEFIISKLEENRKKIQTGEVKMPVILPLIPNVMNYNESDKKKVLKFFDEQITNYKNSIKALEGQIGHRYDEYTESAVRNREFLNTRYGHLVAQTIVPDRKLVKDEENLFEAEFEKMMQDPKVMAEFNAKKKEAIKENTKRETKKDR